MDENEKPKFKCSECQELTVSDTDMEIHLAAVHLEYYPYGCTVCGIFCPTSPQMDLHIRLMHQDDDIIPVTLRKDGKLDKKLTKLLRASRVAVPQPPQEKSLRKKRTVASLDLDLKPTKKPKLEKLEILNFEQNIPERDCLWCCQLNRPAQYYETEKDRKVHMFFHVQLTTDFEFTIPEDPQVSARLYDFLMEKCFGIAQNIQADSAACSLLNKEALGPSDVQEIVSETCSPVIQQSEDTVSELTNLTKEQPVISQIVGDLSGEGHDYGTLAGIHVQEEHLEASADLLILPETFGPAVSEHAAVPVDASPAIAAHKEFPGEANEALPLVGCLPIAESLTEDINEFLPAVSEGHSETSESMDGSSTSQQLEENIFMEPARFHERKTPIEVCESLEALDVSPNLQKFPEDIDEKPVVSELHLAVTEPAEVSSESPGELDEVLPAVGKCHLDQTEPLDAEEVLEELNQLLPAMPKDDMIEAAPEFLACSESSDVAARTYEVHEDVDEAAETTVCPETPKIVSESESLAEHKEVSSEAFQNKENAALINPLSAIKDSNPFGLAKILGLTHSAVPEVSEAVPISPSLAEDQQKTVRIENLEDSSLEDPDDDSMEHTTSDSSCARIRPYQGKRPKIKLTITRVNHGSDSWKIKPSDSKPRKICIVHPVRMSKQKTLNSVPATANKAEGESTSRGSEKPFRTCMCGKRVSNRQTSLAVHAASHFQRFFCKYCDRGNLIFEFQIRAHTLITHPTEPLEYSENFYSNPMFQRECVEKCFSGDSPHENMDLSPVFNCSMCPQATVTLKTWKNHVFEHLKEKYGIMRFSCKFCALKTEYISQIRAHSLICHKVENGFQDGLADMKTFQTFQQFCMWCFPFEGKFFLRYFSQ